MRSPQKSEPESPKLSSSAKPAQVAHGIKPLVETKLTSETVTDSLEALTMHQQELFKLATLVAPELIESRSWLKIFDKLATVCPKISSDCWAKLYRGRALKGEQQDYVMKRIQNYVSRNPSPEINAAAIFSSIRSEVLFSKKIDSTDSSKSKNTIVACNQILPTPNTTLDLNSSEGRTKLTNQSKTPPPPHSPVTNPPVLNSKQLQIYNIALIVCPEECNTGCWNTVIKKLHSHIPEVPETIWQETFNVEGFLFEYLKPAQQGVERFIRNEIERGLPFGAIERLRTRYSQLNWETLHKPKEIVDLFKVEASLIYGEKIKTPSLQNTRDQGHDDDHASSDEGQESSRKRSKNIYEEILKYGHAEDFDPVNFFGFLPTDAPAGSQEKIEALRKRIELGHPLWHQDDRVDYSGLTGAVRPREE